jgi:hypothetical protein
MDEMSLPIATECRSRALSFRAQNIHVISTTLSASGGLIGDKDIETQQKENNYSVASSQCGICWYMYMRY